MVGFLRKMVHGGPENLEKLLAYLGHSACLATTFNPRDKLHSHCGESKRSTLTVSFNLMPVCLINGQIFSLIRSRRDREIIRPRLNLNPRSSECFS